MSYLRKAKEACGRYPHKPFEKDDSLNYEDDESMPIQDQIDNLRAKISLKEKYNKALSEEVAESNIGAAAYINELSEQTRQLREELVYEKNAEKHAIKKALRTHRLFYLAMSENEALTVINWLDDKIFDSAKTLNEGLDVIKKMQGKLADAETQVYYLEQCPVPGSELWEQKAENDRVTLECAIEARKANKDAVLILNKKYHEILYALKSEQAKWPRVMLSMEKNMKQLRAELVSLEVMLEEAIKFRDDAREKFELTEEEFHINRKQLRTQKFRMKKTVEKALQFNITMHNAASKSVKINHSKPFASSVMSTQSIFQEIKAKQIQLHEYEDTVNQLSEVMKVTDVRQCPKRLITVRKVAETLEKETKMKEELRDLLIKHKYRLNLILYYYRYTGEEKENEFRVELLIKQKALEEAEEELEIKKFEMNKDGKVIRRLRFAMIGLDDILHQGKRRQSRVENEGLHTVMRRLLERVRELVKSFDSLRKMFPEGEKPRYSYASYVKFRQNAQHVRVGAPDEMDIDDNSDQDLDIDSKTPSRQELKMRSERFYAQALLKRGLR